MTIFVLHKWQFSVVQQNALFWMWVWQTEQCSPYPKRIYVLIPKIFEYVSLRDTWDLELQMELRFLISWPKDRDIIPDFLDRPDVNYKGS